LILGLRRREDHKDLIEGQVEHLRKFLGALGGSKIVRIVSHGSLSRLRYDFGALME
jgi:hypothetical protein